MTKLKRPFHTTICLKASDLSPRYMESELYGVAFYKSRPPVIVIEQSDNECVLPFVREAIGNRYPEDKIIKLDGSVPDMPDINYKSAQAADNVWVIVTGVDREKHYDEIRRVAENGLRVILVCCLTK